MDAILLQAFHSNLSSGLQKLEDSLGENFMTIDWMQYAVNILRTSHAAFLNIAETDRFPEECINAFMDETVRLLIVCKDLKNGISRLQIYEQVIQRTFDVTLQEDGVHHEDIRAALRLCGEILSLIHQRNEHYVDLKLEAEEKLWSNLTVGRQVASRYANPFDLWGVIYPLKNIISFISTILLWGLRHMDSSYPAKLTSICSTSAWATSTSNSQQTLIKQIGLRFCEEKRNKILLAEFGSMQAYVDKFSIEFESFEEQVPRLFFPDVTELRHSLNILKHGLECLEWTIDDLFDDIVEGRKRLLLSVARRFS